MAKLLTPTQAKVLGAMAAGARLVPSGFLPCHEIEGKGTEVIGSTVGALWRRGYINECPSEETRVFVISARGREALDDHNRLLGVQALASEVAHG